MQKKNEGLLGGILLFTGALIGSAITMLIKENRPINAGFALKNIKDELQYLGEIQGSWIDYDPIEYELFETVPLVYLGGLSVMENGQLKQYQFAADIYTGELVDYYQLNIE